jgi:2-amino-4-hydroxy-6-hydroxymethyldihydropteridine diphosphokinase
MAHEAALSFGANLGAAKATFLNALGEISRRDIGRVTAVSSLWRTPPWGKKDQPDFYNACALIETKLSPRALLGALQQIERDLGRARAEKWGPRVIDIDIVAYDCLALDESDFILPHRQALERAFVLAPLAEIAPHMLLGATRVIEALARVDGADLSIAERGGGWAQV